MHLCPLCLVCVLYLWFTLIKQQAIPLDVLQMISTYSLTDYYGLFLIWTLNPPTCRRVYSRSESLSRDNR